MIICTCHLLPTLAPWVLGMKLNGIENVTICSRGPGKYGLDANFDRLFIVFTCHPLPTPTPGALEMKLNGIENVTIRSRGPGKYGLVANVDS